MATTQEQATPDNKATRIHPPSDMETRSDSPTTDLDLEKADEAAKTPDAPSATTLPPLRVLAPVMSAIYLAVFLLALDRTIIGTAIPRITDEFHSISDVGWYGSAYLLAGSCFQLLFGRIYTFYSPKIVFLTTIFIFELGSALCGAAVSSNMLIAGRAIAGLGSAGVQSGGMVLMVDLVPLQKRPLLIAAIGIIMGVSSVLGPIVGGALTTSVSWRWCFYINLPVGAVTLLVIVLILKSPEAKHAGLSYREQLDRLDPLGTAVVVPCIVCLLLALQWGGSTYAWSNYRVVLCLVLFALLLPVFVLVQWRKGDTATVPPRIILNRSIASGAFFLFCVGASMFLAVYYLPIWFQATKGVSAVHSGIMNIPLVAALVIAAMSAGFFSQKVGPYKPAMLLCSVLIPIGAGLLSTFQVDTGHAKWIGYQVIFGFGLGLGMQQPNLAAQTVLARPDVPTGVAIMFFAQQMGGAVFVSVGQNVLSNELIKGLAGVPGVSPREVVDTGATELRTVFGEAELERVLVAYNHAVSRVFIVMVVVASLSVIGAVSIEWRSIKKRGKGGAVEPTPGRQVEEKK